MLTHGFQILSTQTFTVLVVMSVLVTALVSPLLNAVVRPTKRFVAYKRRTIRWPNPDSELRVLACVHTPRDVPSLISLLDISHPTKRSPIFVYALHLVELTGRAATLLVNNNAPPSKDSHTIGLGRLQNQTEHIVHAFESYEQHAGGISVQTLTTFSPYSTMHDDVSEVAEDKHAAFIILPFHKHQTVDGGMEVTHPSIRSVNQSVLAAAPCSVGILVDRGLGGATRGHRATHHVALLFFGGRDDREALAFATRLLGHPGISLTVLRFLPSSVGEGGGSPEEERTVTVVVGDDREKRMDDMHIEEFRSKIGGDAGYLEREANNAEETVAAIREMAGVHDLYIVGRGQGVVSPLTAGLTEWSECPELGPIGDLLATSDFASAVSVLVVQQGKAMGGRGVDAMAGPESPGRQVRLYLNKADYRTKGMGGQRV